MWELAHVSRNSPSYFRYHPDSRIVWVDLNEGDKKSVNDFEEEKLNKDDGDSNNSNLKENVDESLAKQWAITGWVLNNLPNIIESQGASIVDRIEFGVSAEDDRERSGHAQKAKKDDKSLCVKNKAEGNFLAFKKQRWRIDLFSVLACW
ncbi:hypothetical protein Tco_0592406 [Tanacetum coccineum]